MRITRFNKAVVSGLATILDVLVATTADNVIDMSEKQHIILTLLTVSMGVWAVYRVPNAKENDA